MWSRRDCGRWLASAALGAGLPAAMGQVRPVAPPAAPRAPFGRVQLAVENKSAFCYLPLTIAERLGYFASEGLDVQVRDLSEPGQALQAHQRRVADVIIERLIHGGSAIAHTAPRLPRRWR